MIEPKTYWEERCNTLEGLVVRLADLLANHLPSTRPSVAILMKQWETILDDIDKGYEGKV